MAEKRSTYVFPSEALYNEVRDHLYRQMSSDCGDSNKIHFFGYWGSCSKFDWDTCYRIDIYSDCSDAAKAADIFREHGGRFYE